MSEAQGTASPEGDQEDLFKSFSENNLFPGGVREIDNSKNNLCKVETRDIDEELDGNESDCTLTASECEDEDGAVELRYVYYEKPTQIEFDFLENGGIIEIFVDIISSSQIN